MIRSPYLSLLVVANLVISSNATTTDLSYPQWKDACFSYIENYDSRKATTTAFFSWLRTHKITSLHFEFEPTSDKKDSSSKATSTPKILTLREELLKPLVTTLALQEKDVFSDYAKQTTLLPVSKETFTKTHNACVDVYINELTNKKNWVKQTALSLEKPLKNTFQPYVQKCMVQPGATVTVIGDLHGDALSLMNTLDHVLDDSFTLKNNHYLIFLGDYTDRGPCGLEVLYTLFKLKVANPNNVFLLRGNHEDTYINEYGRFFGSELINKLGLTTRKDRQNFIYNFYELLPVALYLGTPNNDYVLFCHGGLEVGFDPAPLLNACPTTSYMLLGKLNRASALTKLSPKKDSLKVALDATFVKDNLDNITPAVPRDLHFLWNDFHPELNTTYNFFHEAGWEYGELLTHAVLNRDGIKALIRGHNHKLALKGGGLHSLYDGLVTTLTSFRWHGPSEFFKEYSFMTIHIKPSFTDWQAWHERDGQKKEIKLADASTHIVTVQDKTPVECNKCHKVHMEGAL